MLSFKQIPKVIKCEDYSIWATFTYNGGKTHRKSSQRKQISFPVALRHAVVVSLGMILVFNNKLPFLAFVFSFHLRIVWIEVKHPCQHYLIQYLEIVSFQFWGTCTNHWNEVTSQALVLLVLKIFTSYWIMGLILLLYFVQLSD